LIFFFAKVGTTIITYECNRITSQQTIVDAINRLWQRSFTLIAK